MPTLAVFARNPALGRVKTRLTPALPAPLAATLYTGLLADTVAAAAACSGATTRVLCWAEIGRAHV